MEAGGTLEVRGTEVLRTFQGCPPLDNAASTCAACSCPPPRRVLSLYSHSLEKQNSSTPFPFPLHPILFVPFVPVSRFAVIDALLFARAKREPQLITHRASSRELEVASCGSRPRFHFVSIAGCACLRPSLARYLHTYHGPLPIYPGSPSPSRRV